MCLRDGVGVNGTLLRLTSQAWRSIHSCTSWMAVKDASQNYTQIEVFRFKSEVVKRLTKYLLLFQPLVLCKLVHLQIDLRKYEFFNVKIRNR